MAEADSGEGIATVSDDEFERMAEDLSPALFGAALRLTRDRSRAEDLVQETLLRAYKGLGGFQEGTNFQAWIFRILHNAFLTSESRRRKAPVSSTPWTKEPVDPHRSLPALRDLEDLPAMIDRYFDERVKAAVDGIPGPFRDALVLRVLGGLSYAEIAGTLGVPVGTVMSRIHRARTILRKDLLEFAREHGFRPRRE